MKWPSIHTRVTLSLLVVTPLGFAFKFYSGPGNGWFNNYGAGVLYEIFWILLAFLFFPSKRSANVIPVYVFLITCILEFLQLWHPSFLEVTRSSFLVVSIHMSHRSQPLNAKCTLWLWLISIDLLIFFGHI